MEMQSLLCLVLCQSFLFLPPRFINIAVLASRVPSTRRCHLGSAGLALIVVCGGQLRGLQSSRWKSLEEAEEL